MITKIYLEWFPCEKYITGMPLGLFSQKMKLRARFPISEGERPGKRPEENRATTKPDERSQNKLSERRGTGDIWYETGVLIFPVWGIQQMTTKRLVFLCSKTAPYRFFT